MIYRLCIPMKFPPKSKEKHHGVPIQITMAIRLFPNDG